MPSPEASRLNLKKAMARWRRPLPWRSEQETRLIKRAVWRWYRYREPKCSGRGLALWLGVSHTYVQKLKWEFAKNPEQWLRLEKRDGLPNSDQLREAQERSRRMREAGQLRWFRVRSPRSLIAIIEASHRSSADLTSDYSAIFVECLRMDRKRDKMSGFGRRRRYGSWRFRGK